MTRCPNCSSEITVHMRTKGYFRCARCGVRTEFSSKAKAKSHVGIHPLLARRYEDAAPKSRADLKQLPLSHEEVATLDEWPGVPGYELVGRIGKGAMGSVFRATHLASRRDTAVKILAKELVKRADLVARFEREAAALRSFRHRNVVAIFDSGTHEHTHYFCMEYIDGITLRRCLKQGALGPVTAVRFARQIAKALKAAHERGIIHRDLKPENIIIEGHQTDQLTGLERLVLVDFGLAGIVNEAADPHPNLTHSRVTMGTVNYMAPEQHVDAKRVDYRTDLYALGVIFYECLTSDLPLGRFLLPKEKGIRVPHAVDAFLVKALARLPDERFQSAEEMDEALAQIEVALSEAHNEPLTHRSLVPKKRSPLGSQLYQRPSRQSVLSTVYPTKWMTSPPWIKRPQIAIGAAVVALGIAAALLFVHQTPTEVLVSPERVTPVFQRGTLKAPLPEVVDADNKVKAMLAQETETHPAIAWRAESPAWAKEGSRIGYFAQQGDAAHFRRDLSLAVAPNALSFDKPIAFHGQMRFEGVQLSMGAAKAQHLAREALGGTPELSSGGLFFVNDSLERAIGMVVYADGSCGLVELLDDNGIYRGVQYQRGRCKKPDLGKNIPVTLSCDPKTQVCQGTLAGGSTPETQIPGLKDERWHLALGCRNIVCLFDMPNR